MTEGAGKGALLFKVVEGNWRRGVGGPSTGRENGLEESEEKKRDWALRR